MDRLDKEPFDEFLVDAARLAFTVPLSHGYKYPEEVLELPGRSREQGNRRWYESIVFEIVDDARIEITYNRSSGRLSNTAPVDSYEGVMIAFDIVDGAASEQVWTRRLAKRGGLKIFPLVSDSTMEGEVRIAVIEGLVERHYKQEEQAAYRRERKKLLGRRATKSNL